MAGGHSRRGLAHWAARGYRNGVNAAGFRDLDNKKVRVWVCFAGLFFFAVAGEPRFLVL